VIPNLRPSPTPRSAPDPVDAYLEALGAGSRRTIEQSLAVITTLLTKPKPRTVAPRQAGAELTIGQEPADPRGFDWGTIDQAAVARLRRELAERYAPATANKILAALRGVLRVCRDQGRINEAQFQAATRFDGIKSFAAAESRVLSEAELKRLFRGCAEDGTAAGRRDAAALAIFLATGLRREEAVALDVGDYDPRPRKRTLHIRSDIAERDRVAELGKPACAAIDHWLEARGHDEDAADTPLLLPVDKGGTIRTRRLTTQAIYGIVIRAAKRAGLPHTTTRDLRRTCIVRLIRAGLDLDQVRQRVGHASWLTTAAYQVMAEEAGRLKTPDLPYQRPPDRPRPSST